MRDHLAQKSLTLGEGSVGRCLDAEKIRAALGREGWMWMSVRDLRHAWRKDVTAKRTEVMMRTVMMRYVRRVSMLRGLNVCRFKASAGSKDAKNET